MTDNYKLGLIGYPLGHSLSPILHACAFKSVGLNGTYEALPTESEDLISRIKFLKTHGYYGFNVTIPHKVPISLFISKFDEFVNITGAVNTVKIEDDLTLSAYNTDVSGFMEAIPKGCILKDCKAVVIGTGGASRAVVAGLYKLGVNRIDIYTRNVINSKETVDMLKERFKGVEIRSLQMSLMDGLEDVDILVNTTPVGMRNFDEDNSPVSDRNIESLPNSAIVYDIVYNPLKTALISKAIKYHKKYITGLDMLTYQAQKSFEIWTGKKPDFYAMKAGALEYYIMNGF